MARNPDETALDAYLAALRRHPLLTRREEHVVAVQFAQTGSAALAARLVNANLRLVVKIALEYRRTSADLQDLIQEGNLGLVHAVQKYDPHRGFKLSTYAGWWILAYILKFIQAHWHLVRIWTSPAHRRVFFGLRRERTSHPA